MINLRNEIIEFDQEKGKFYIREPPLFFLKKEVEQSFASNCCRIVYALWSSFALQFIFIQLNFIQINMHTFLAQFSFTHSQLNLHTPFQINLHSHIDQSHFLLNPSFLEGLAAFTCNMRISNKKFPLDRRKQVTLQADSWMNNPMFIPR